MNFLVYRVGAFSHTKDQRTLHCPNAPHVDLHISWKVFGREGFYLIFKMFLYCFSKFSVLCYFSNFPPAANWHKDGQRVQRGARPISCFSQIFLFSKESRCCCNFQLFEEDPSTKTHSFRRSRWQKMPCWKLFLEIFLMTQLLCKKSCSYCYQYQYIREGFQKTKVYSKGLDQYPYFSKYISISLENIYVLLHKIYWMVLKKIQCPYNSFENVFEKKTKNFFLQIPTCVPSVVLRVFFKMFLHVPFWNVT